jgi:hypothetical protein
MRILLRFELDCTPDAAWLALRSPAVFRAVAAPLTTFSSREPDGFPTVWSAGEHPALGRAFGLVPVGEQIIDISTEERADGVRIVHDDGRGTSGALAAITVWHHSMAVSAIDDERTLYRDQLVFRAGILTLPVWAGLWLFWQWRGLRIRQLAPAWRA